MITNHYGVTVDSKEPVTGVHQNNRIDHLWEDIPDAIDLNYEGGLNEFVHQKISEIQVILDEMDGETMEAFAREIKDICDQLEYPQDQFDCCDTTDWLFGFERVFRKEEAWFWFDDLRYGYKPDEKAEYSAIVGEIYTQVVKSKWLIRCALCSPCYPGQGDVDSHGEFLAFSVPPDMYEEKDPMRDRIFCAPSSRPTQYRIHSVDECGRDVFWSNEMGWVEEGYTLFSEVEKAVFKFLPKHTGESNWQGVYNAI